ncbi:MAG: acyl-CoA dehydrogenase [Sphingomicrobium sp.]
MSEHGPSPIKENHMSFACPVRDQRLVLESVVRIDQLAASERFREATPDTVDAVLEGAAQFAQGEFAPLDRIGDTVGARWSPEGVAMPKGFHAAYAAFIEGGWMTLAAPTDAGGQGLPLALSAALMEDLNAANVGFALCPMLSMGAIEALEAHGSEQQKTDYLPRIVSGEWPATMNLTESQAGSDVGALKTKAEPNGDGSWKISGTKIYITYGEHDLAENIIHLVLARTPGSPEGTRGISLFLVPKVLPDGSQNDLRCVSIEHKLGIHASPTCLMSFGDDGGATGWLIGEERAGMKAMFTMMNNARLNVALQGVGIAERATQRAVEYALERRQLGKAIADHPDVRRMLLRMRALTNAARALTYYAFGQLDRKAKGDAEAGSRAEVLTPLAKAWCTDVGCEVASLGVQIHGGMGYVEETGAAQHLRDARIAPIYEGTNGIQAADLVGRKLGLDGGTAFDALIADVRAEVRDARLFALADAVEVTAASLRHSEPEDGLAGSYPFLTMCAVLVAGWLMERMACGSPGKESFDQRTRAAADYFISAIVPEAKGLTSGAGCGTRVLYAVSAEALA